MLTIDGRVPAATLSLTISGLSGCFSGASVSLNGSFTMPRRIYTPMPGVTITVCDEWQYSDTFTDAGGITRTRVINVIRGTGNAYVPAMTTATYADASLFPSTGVVGIRYIETATGDSYTWRASSGYVLVDVWSIAAYGFYQNLPFDPYDRNDVFEGFSLAQCCESVAVISNSICGMGTATITWDL